MRARFNEFLNDKEAILSYLKCDLEIETSRCQIVDSVVNCSASIDISSKDIYDLAVQFGEVKGDFICNGCLLQTLIGMPFRVGGNFSCIENDLINLEFAPKYVGGDFDCSSNNLTSLEFAPKFVGKNFRFMRNRISSFEHCPKIIKGDFFCSSNLISSFEHCPDFIKGSADFSNNNFSSLEYSPRVIQGYINLSYNPIQTLKHLPANVYRFYIEAVPLLSTYNTNSNPSNHKLLDYKDYSNQELKDNFDNLQFHAKIFRENRSDGYYDIGFEKERLLYPTLAEKCQALYTAWPWLYIEFCKYERSLLEHFDYRTNQ